MARDEKPNDPLPGLLAEIDQAMKMAPTLARWAMSMFSAFSEAGFSEEQSLRLTMNQLKASTDD